MTYLTLESCVNFINKVYNHVKTNLQSSNSTDAIPTLQQLPLRANPR